MTGTTGRCRSKESYCLLIGEDKCGYVQCIMLSGWQHNNRQQVTPFTLRDTTLRCVCSQTTAPCRSIHFDMCPCAKTSTRHSRFLRASFLNTLIMPRSANTQERAIYSLHGLSGTSLFNSESRNSTARIDSNMSCSPAPVTVPTPNSTQPTLMGLPGLSLPIHLQVRTTMVLAMFQEN